LLVLSRKVGEVIKIGDDIELMIVRIGPNTVRIGISAPRELNIVRGELIAVNAPEAAPLDHPVVEEQKEPTSP